MTAFVIQSPRVVCLCLFPHIFCAPRSFSLARLPTPFASRVCVVLPAVVRLWILLHSCSYLLLQRAVNTVTWILSLTLVFNKGIL